MCYFKSNTANVQQVEARFQVAVHDPSRYLQRVRENGFNHLKSAVITQQKPGEVSFLRWGLIPSWVKDKASALELRTKTLNARAETLFEKASFKKSIESRRCLVIATGYFEWMHEGKKKIPHFLHLKDNEPFAMGGIYDSWVDPSTGEIVETYSVITTEANPLAARIHNSKQRMPFILPRELERIWLKENLSTFDLQEMLRPFPDEKMEAWQISENNWKQLDDQDPKILEPYVDPSSLQGSLF